MGSFERWLRDFRLIRHSHCGYQTEKEGQNDAGLILDERGNPIIWERYAPGRPLCGGGGSTGISCEPLRSHSFAKRSALDAHLLSNHVRDRRPPRGAI